MGEGLGSLGRIYLEELCKLNQEDFKTKILKRRGGCKTKYKDRYREQEYKRQRKRRLEKGTIRRHYIREDSRR